MSNTSVSLFEKTKERKLEIILNSFNIKSENIELTEGDYLDTYDISLSPGIKVNKLERALVDIGLSLKSQNIPRGFPVLRKGVYRIEVQKRELASKPFGETYYKDIMQYIPIALGVDANGENFNIDLHRLPNLLIGGVPGSGKSMLLHSIILSLIKCNSEIYLIDPKMVEFNIYDRVQGVERIETTIAGTYEVINIVTEEMNRRFSLLSSNKCRNVFEYNRKVKEPARLAPVVIVVDEWADIVLQDSKIQKPLCAIAQKGRAAGISIILATQRPSVSVISGLIKASFSGRIGLRVASNVDSRIILDQSGAEKIVEVGSGLYIDQRTLEPILFRTPYIEDPLDYISNENVKPLSFWKRIWS